MLDNEDGAPKGPEDQNRLSLHNPGKDKSPKSGKSAQAKLLALADRHLIVACNAEGRPMVAMRSTPHLYYALSESGCIPIAMLIRQYRFQYGAPNRSAISSAVAVLKSAALLQDRIEIHLRSAWAGGVLWIDSGWEDASVFRIDANGWEVMKDCPVAFTRTPQTGSLPDPRDVEADAEALGRYLNCDRDDLALMKSVLVTSWMSHVPQPVLALFGPADAGKTTGMQFLLDLVDPSTTQAGGQWDPDPRAFKAIASVRRVLVFDNVSSIDAEASDLLARICTGGEIVSRALYTDDAAHVTQLRRPIWMTGIMEGFNRSDLASRSVLVTLSSIKAKDRASFEDLWTRWAMDRPAIFRALLDLTVEFLSRRDRFPARGQHRMTEFVSVLRVVDFLDSTRGEGRLKVQGEALADAVLDSSALARAIRRAVECGRDGKANCPYCSDTLNARGTDVNIFDKRRTADLRAALRRHITDEEDRYLTTDVKRIGEELTRISADLEKRLRIRVVRERTNKGAVVTFTDAS